MTYFIEKISFSILWAFVISVISGYFSFIGTEFSLARTIGLFPFFLIGYLLKKEHIEFIKNKRTKIAAVLSFIILMTILYFVGEKFNYGWLWFNYSYSYFGISGEKAAFMKIFIYAIITLYTFAFLILVPSKKIKLFTKAGAYSLYAYLLHGFIIRTVFSHGIPFHVNIGLQLLTLFFGSLILALFLTSYPIVTLLKPIMEPIKVYKICRVKIKASKANNPNISKESL